MFPPAQSINLSIILTPFFPLYPVSKHLTNSLALPCRAHRILPWGSTTARAPTLFHSHYAVACSGLHVFIFLPPIPSLEFRIQSHPVKTNSRFHSTETLHFSLKAQATIPSTPLPWFSSPHNLFPWPFFLNFIWNLISHHPAIHSSHRVSLLWLKQARHGPASRS